MGQGNIPVHWSWHWVPELVSGPAGSQESQIDTTIIGGVTPSVQRVIPSDVAPAGPLAQSGNTQGGIMPVYPASPVQNPDGTWEPGGGTERLARQVLGLPVLPHHEYAATIPVEQGGTLGLITDIATIAAGAYVASRTPQPVGNHYPQAPNLTPTMTNAVGIPFVDVIPETDSCARKVWDPRANCGQGKWITKRRKRRKRLATASDIKDLSALKSVLGGGKGLDTWIATH